MRFARFTEGRGSIALAAAIAGLAWFGTILPSGEAPRFAALTPIVYAMVVLADGITAYVLLATWKFTLARRSTIVLASSFATTATLVFFATLALPLLPHQPPMLAVPDQAGIWLYVMWHLTGGAGTLGYVAFRSGAADTHPSRRFMLATAIVAGCSLLAALALPFGLVQWLPVLTSATSIAPLIHTGIGPLTACVLAIATVLAFRIRDPRPIDRALAISVLAYTLELALFMKEGHRYSDAYYVGRIMVMIGALLVLAAAIRTLVAARIQLHDTEKAVAVLEVEASTRAGRIRALWKISSQSGRSQESGFNAILQTATAALRPNKEMFGVLSHLDDGRVVIDATSWSASEPQTAVFAGAVYPGATFDLERTMQSRLYEEHRTLAWSDLSHIAGMNMICEEYGWRSFIGTCVTIGTTTHFLSFVSPERMLDQPFAEDDIAYVDVVASFFAARFSEDLHFERLRFQMEHDALTGLHNRAQFRNAVRAELRNGNAFTLAFVNLDQFRLVNERQGHMLGDEVLVEIAIALNSVNSANFVARMSGDEFGVLIRGVRSHTDSDAALDRYAQQFRTPFHTGDRDGTRMLSVGASIGAARFPADGPSAEDLMRRADVALSIAKQRGGSTTIAFDSSMEAILEQSNVRLVELTDAIERDHLALVYQPTFDLATRAITGAEALVRWDHPERGRLLPGEFIPFAERNALVTPLTRWVLRRLIADLSSARPLPPGFRVYFNVAVQTLDDFPFIAELNEALRAAPGIAAHIGIEMTETAAMQNVESSMHTIDLFRRWGLYVAIDDFGTGYSSLSYLKQLSVDVIKIDRSFITGLPADERDGAITDMLLQITNRFGFATLAEGIETEEQAAWLLAHGCRFGQGYLVARPDSFAALVERLPETAALA